MLLLKYSFELLYTLCWWGTSNVGHNN